MNEPIADFYDPIEWPWSEDEYIVRKIIQELVESMNNE
jgi:hypothetical protein